MAKPGVVKPTLGCLETGVTNPLQIAQPVLALGAAEPEMA